MSTETKSKVLQALDGIYNLCQEDFKEISIERIFKSVDAPYPFLAQRVLIHMDMIEKQPGRIEKFAIKWIGNKPNENMAEFVFARLSALANGKPLDGMTLDEFKSYPDNPEIKPIDKPRREIKIGEVVKERSKVDQVFDALRKNMENNEPVFIAATRKEHSHLTPEMVRKDQEAEGKEYITDKMKDIYQEVKKGNEYAEEKMKFFEDMLQACSNYVLIEELQRRGYKGELYLEKISI